MVDFDGKRQLRSDFSRLFFRFCTQDKKLEGVRQAVTEEKAALKPFVLYRPGFSVFATLAF
jgi:hypothetical protein